VARRTPIRTSLVRKAVGGGITPAVAVQIIGLYTLTTVLVGALVIWLVDRDDFPNYGLALWWAVQTVTTVGYGDIVPTHLVGRIVAAVVMLTGIALITVVSGAVASGLLQSVRRKRGADPEQRLMAELEAIHRRLDELGSPPRD
jgi:voltage-gated potassium channel